MDSQIFQVIDEMEEYVSNCKGKFMSSTEIICNRDQMEEYLRDLRRKAPAEIEKYRKVIARQEEILSDAKNKAQKLIDDTMAQTDELLSQNEIMRRAYEQADEIVRMANEQAQVIVDNATIEANNLKSGATQYMEEIMVYLENIFTSSSNTLNDQYGNLINTLNMYGDKVREDHKQLYPKEGTQVQGEAAAEQ